MRHVLSATLMFAGLFTCQSSLAQNEHSGHAEHAGHGAVGKVNFANSCIPAVQEDFARGIAMLHSFWYTAAEPAPMITAAA